MASPRSSTEALMTVTRVHQLTSPGAVTRVVRAVIETRLATPTEHNDADGALWGTEHHGV
jgi:hypothetical protein